MEKENGESDVITCRLKDLKDIVASMPEGTMLCVEWEDDGNERK